MLSEKEVKGQLEESRVKEWRAELCKRVDGLPRKLRAIGQDLLEDEHASKRCADDEEERRLELSSALDGMKSDQRLRLFVALFPTYADYVEAAWQAQKSSAFEVDWESTAVRAPSNPLFTLLIRYSWLGYLVKQLGGYEEDVEWVAAFAPHLPGWNPDAISPLLSAIMDSSSDDGGLVYKVLCDSATGVHKIGGMGHHVIRAMLGSSRREGWEYCGKMLLAAQRQEGLRQALLESLPDAHPGAFRHMLGVVLENDLGRFSATVNSLNSWLGYRWDSASVKEVNKTLERLICLLDDIDARNEALASDDAELAYLSLWVTAAEDVEKAVAPAVKMLSDPAVERRFVATHLLAQLPIAAATEGLSDALQDEDLRVVARGVFGLESGYTDTPISDRMFDLLEKAVERFPAKKKTFKAIVWPWMVPVADCQEAAALLERNLGNRDPGRLLPLLQMMAPYTRECVAERLAETKEWTEQARETLLVLLADSSVTVREKAIEALRKTKIKAAEVPRLEKMLTRKASNLRRGILGMLIELGDEAVLDSANRLSKTKNVSQQLAGLELFRLMVEADRSVDDCRDLAEQYRVRHANNLTDDETRLLDMILTDTPETATLDDAFGLVDPRDRTKPQPPRNHKVNYFTKTTFELLKSLDDLVHENRNVSIKLESGGGKSEKLLGDFRWDMPHPDVDLTSAEDWHRLPLGDVWADWLARMESKHGDLLGLELVRVFSLVRTSGDNYFDEPGTPLDNDLVGTVARGLGPVMARYPTVLEGLLAWFPRAHPCAEEPSFLMDGLETLLAQIPKEELRIAKDEDSFDEVHWRDCESPSQEWLDVVRRRRDLCGRKWAGAENGRLFGLLRWIDEPIEGLERDRPQFEEVWDAFEAGFATEADLLDQLMGPRKLPESPYDWNRFNDLREFSTRKPSGLAKKHGIISDLVDRCRRRILDIELGRGETPTVATWPAMALRWAGEMDVLVRLLVAMGKESFVRGWSYDSLSKAAVFSHLIRVTSPGEADTAEKFAERIAECKLKEKRLLELAVYAPQWVDHVEHALEWPGLAEAVWWVHAHTKDEHWSVEDDIREQWASAVSQRTPLVAEDLTCGAVDVGWFVKVQSTLGADRWAKLDKVAKLASSGAGHKRAQLFADAMLAKVAKKDLLTRIADKRHQDSVRALGLLPLAEGDGRKKDLLERYGVLQEFLRGSRKFGSQRQASEKRAMEIGLHNLARTAGYPDPLRFQWAMEREEVADLAAGSVTVTVDDVEVSLAIDDSGQPELSVIKKGKKLKSIPAKLRKNEEIAELRERKTQIKRQASRSRLALEEAMCRGDAFTAAEIRELSTHPVLSPMISRLVFSGDGVLGYPVDQGQGLCDHAGKIEPIKKKEVLRIAHPYDLFETGEWHLWQRDCFRRELIQPFKQVFRELYVITDAEKEEGNKSRRYAGQQVHPRQAMALLGKRGWVASYDDGVHRTFHDQNITAYIGILGDVTTPAEVEGVTVETVFFCERGKWKELLIAEIDPRVLSETMRDVDLVVSVAHRGGVDPEATASTRQMRSALIRETCALLEIDNVHLQDGHALIDGELSEYSVHLGSGVVHRRPGGMLCIVPVHAQHRGRLFLPFADDDPKTAEIMSKVLMLARDSEIKDPTILEQLRG